MSLVVKNEGAVVSAEGVVFGAKTAPRTIGDLLKDGNDILPLYKGGVMTITTKEELPTVGTGS